MSNHKKSVEELYIESAVVEFIRKAQEGEVSDYVQNAYRLCKSQLGNMSLQEFAAYIANYNPNKSGIGEKSQLEWLKVNKFSTIEKLSNRGKEALSLFKMPDGTLTVVKGKKSNLQGVKSFDAIAVLTNMICLFVLKTVDIGNLSDSVGGGHQSNVMDEITNLVNHVHNQQLTLAGKPVKVYVVVDGRSADSIIKTAQNIAGNSPHIIINESAHI